MPHIIKKTLSFLSLLCSWSTGALPGSREVLVLQVAKYRLYARDDRAFAEGVWRRQQMINPITLILGGATASDHVLWGFIIAAGCNKTCAFKMLHPLRSHHTFLIPQWRSGSRCTWVMGSAQKSPWSLVAAKSCEPSRPCAECIIAAPGPWWGQVLILSSDKSPLCSSARLRVGWGRMHSNESNRTEWGTGLFLTRMETFTRQKRKELGGLCLFIYLFFLNPSLQDALLLFIYLFFHWTHLRSEPCCAL